MNIITGIREMQEHAKLLKEKGKTIGFVPTMGYLHEGHQALMRAARKENDIVVVSVFVNPIQFGEGEDLDSYPRDFDRDQAAAESEGADIIFRPSAEDMYPSSSAMKIKVYERTDVLCGNSRPGHFDGVATVLAKLFHIVLPDRAYFGLKDAQQVAVVDGLIKDFNFPVTLVPVPTVREEDGLAKSSRNVYLLPDERKEAPQLYRGLLLAKSAIERGEKDPGRLTELVKDHIRTHTSGEIDYVSIYSYPELKPVQTVETKIIIALAVKFSRARLIDNLILS